MVKNLEFKALNIFPEVMLQLGVQNTISAFNEIVSKGIQIYGLMFEHLRYSGLIKYKNGRIDTDSLDYSAIFKAIDNRFKFHFKKLAFSDEILTQAEISRVIIQQKKGVALNKDMKSLGPPSSDNLLRFLIQCISFGLNPQEIVKAFASQGIEVTEAAVENMANVHLGGFDIARKEFFFPLVKTLKRDAGLSNYEIAKIFMSGNIMLYLDDINEHFKLGYTVKRIVDMYNLDNLIKNCPSVDIIIDAVKQALILSNIDIYIKGMSFTEFRYAVLRENYLKHFKNGAIDFRSLNEEFLGLSSASVQSSFYKAFHVTSIETVYESLTPKERNRIIALHLIDRSLKGTGIASEAQVLADLLRAGTIAPGLRIFSSGSGFEFLTESSWDELYQIALRYTYHSYHRVLQFL